MITLTLETLPLLNALTLYPTRRNIYIYIVEQLILSHHFDVEIERVRSSLKI